MQEDVWASGQVWTSAVNLAPPGIDPRTAQPVASGYTDWAFPAVFNFYTHLNTQKFSVCNSHSNVSTAKINSWRPFKDNWIVVMISNIKCNVWQNTGLFEMIVVVLTTCHIQYIWDRSICVFLFNRTTLQVFVTYLIGALYVHPLWFYKHQHDNRVRSKLSVACQWWWFQWQFWFIPSIPGYLWEEAEHKPDSWRNPIERNHMGFKYIQGYSKWLSWF